MAKLKKAELTPMSFFIIMIIVVILGVFTISYTADTVESIDRETLSDSSELVYISPQTLTAEEGITSATVQTYNNTWLDFDGVDDYVLVESSIYDTISFWYKNSSVSYWTFVANVSGTNYTNSVAGNPNQYPVYFNTTHYFLGKTNATTFFNGSIDDFKKYNSSIDAELVELIYNEGRL